MSLYKRWTPEEDAYLRAAFSKREKPPLEDVAKQLNRPVGGVRDRARALKITWSARGRRTPWTRDEDNTLRKKMRADRLGDYLEKNPWTWVICYVPIDVDRGRALIRTTELPPAQVNRGTVSRRAEDAVASLAEDRAKGKYGGKGKTKKGAKER